MSESMATVMVVVLTGARKHVRAASMKAFDALAAIKDENVGVTIRNTDIKFDHKEIDHGREGE